VIDLDAGDGSLANLQQAVAGFVEVQAHTEGDIWLNDEGRINGLPLNVRATHWVLRDSSMAKQALTWEGSTLYGDCVVTGPADREGEITPVDPELVAYFDGLDRSEVAVADWSERNVEWTVTDWPDHPGRDRGGSGGWDLGF
jgi:hypothetical protein